MGLGLGATGTDCIGEGAGGAVGSSSLHRWRGGDCGSVDSVGDAGSISTAGDGGGDDRVREMGLWHGECCAGYTSASFGVSRRASIQ